MYCPVYKYLKNILIKLIRMGADSVKNYKVMTVLNVSESTKDLFNKTITKDMSQDKGVISLLDFWIKYKGILDKTGSD